MKNKLLTTALLALWLNPVAAATPEEIGLEIAQQVVAHDEGWGDTKVDLLMTLKNREGKETTRKIRVSTLEVESDGDKSLTVFETPKDVKGTGFLSYSHSVVADDQWLYLPALKRVKRISSANKSGPFMGSEFAFEDLSSFEVEKYKDKYLRDETIDGMDSYVVESYPQYVNSGYTRLINWIDKAEYRVLKTEFYDRKNTLLKTLTYGDYQQYLGEYWRANVMYVENVVTGKSTRLEYNDYAFRTGLSEKQFNKNMLKRAR